MILVLNLKMNLTKNTILEYEKAIHNKNVIVMPQYPYLLFFNRGKYSLGSQDVSKFAKGSYTGEVCAKGLRCLGVKYVLVGHSERKEYFHEDGYDFKKKIENVINNDMIPIYCVNQTSEEYENDKELSKIEEQLEAIPTNCKYIIIAYEPSYMIGNTENKEILDKEHLQKVITKIKDYLIERNINHSILYGGGVDEQTISYLKDLNLDGYIMSSSALDINKLNSICEKLGI